MKFSLFILLIFVLKYIKSIEVNTNICTESFCTEYIEKTPCKALPDKCQIQNSTYNGLKVPSPMPCNCCDACLENIEEGGACSVGGLGSPVPDSICGPGLYCDNNVCKKMYELSDKKLMNPCHQELAEYNEKRANGELGMTELPPICEPNGFYEPYKCRTGETCFCVAKDGARIHGEIPYSAAAKYTLNCECSRMFYEAQKYLGMSQLQSHQIFRCKDNGDFDELQCVGDRCFCVNARDGSPDSQAVKIDAIKNLTCYDEAVHNPTFYNPCATRYIQLFEEVEKLKQDYDDVYEFRYPNCDLNGNYGKVQTDLKKQIAYCANPDGTQIKNYQANISEVATMNCNCARSEQLLSNPSDPEKLICASNGNYEKKQCRRGYCFCVDENGYQKEIEKPMDEPLECN